MICLSNSSCASSVRLRKALRIARSRSFCGLSADFFSTLPAIPSFCRAISQALDSCRVYFILNPLNARNRRPERSRSTEQPNSKSGSPTTLKGTCSMSRSKNVPKYALHKSTGQARVIIDGRHHYLGKFGSPESRQKYAALLGQQ